MVETQPVRVTLPAWAEPLMKPATYKSLSGGRCACKSRTFATLAVLRMAWLLPGYPQQPVNIISARDYNATLKASVKTVVVNTIDLFGLADEFEILHNEIRNHRTGSLMFFKGVARDPAGFMSVEDIDVFWMEQAEVLEGGDGSAMDFIEPSIRKEPHEFWFSWNPLGRDGWCWQRFMRNPEPDDIILQVSWRDNPWWPELPSMQKLRLRDKRYEPQLYGWKWEGLPLDGDADFVWLPHDLLAKCVEAFRRGYAPDTSRRPSVMVGMDWAEGGRNQCSVVVREGPIVRRVWRFPGETGRLRAAAERAWRLAGPHDPLRIYYDASTPALGALEEAGFRGVFPVPFGGGVKGGDSLYEEDRTNQEVFLNRSAQMSMGVRNRAINTLRLLDGERVSRWDCLFIDPAVGDCDPGVSLDDVLEEWSQPQRFLTADSKWAVDKAPSRRDKTGKVVRADSPDRYDGLVLAFAADSHERGLVAA